MHFFYELVVWTHLFNHRVFTEHSSRCIGIPRSVNHYTKSSRDYNLTRGYNDLTHKTVHGHAGHCIYQTQSLIGNKRAEIRAAAQNTWEWAIRRR